MVSGETLISKTSAQPACDGRDPVLRVIAVFKFFKGTMLLALSLGAFKLLHKDVGSLLQHWIEAFKLDPGNHFIDALLAKASNLTPGQIKKLGLGSLLYAGLFFVEGTGLWLRKRWGEWFTVIITATLVPVEIYEIVRHPTLIKVAVLAINVAIVWFLIKRIRTKAAPARR
jgi:uncharacterized membrane protein (DUF2068 family)